MAQPGPSHRVIRQPVLTVNASKTLVDSLLNELRALRKEISELYRGLNDALKEGVDSSGNLWNMYQEKCKNANTIYEKLELHAEELPQNSTGFPPMDRLIRLTIETSVDPSIRQLYDQCLETAGWAETCTPLCSYYSQLFRRVYMLQSRSSPSVIERSLAYSDSALGNCKHDVFKETFLSASHDPQCRRLGLRYHFLEENALGTIMELQYGHGIKHYVCYQKLLLVINDGIIEHVLLIAPHEDWTYHDSKRRLVDAFNDSRHFVYQKLTVQANTHVRQIVNSYLEACNVKNMTVALTLLSKLSEAFHLRCKRCLRTLKSGLPPVLFDIRSPHIGLHEDCR